MDFSPVSLKSACSNGLLSLIAVVKAQAGIPMGH